MSKLLKLKGNDFKHRLIVSCIVSIFFSFNICIFAPVEIYLNSIGELWFGLHVILLPIVLLGIAVFLMIAALGILFGGNLFKIYITLVFGVGLALYAQGNYMNNFYGVLDGVLIEWEDFKARGILGLIIWIVCICMPFLFLFKFKKLYEKIIRFVPVAILAIQVITLVTLFLTVYYPKSPIVTVYTAEDNFKFSKNNNVVVFILDDYDSTIFNNQLTYNTKYYDEFKDFVYYKNNAGLFPYTYVSLPHLLTGVPSINDVPTKEYLNNAFANSEFLALLKQNNYEASLFTERAFIPDKMNEVVTNTKEVTLSPRSTKQLLRAIYALTAFRYAPQYIKPVFEAHYTAVFEREKSVTGTDIYTSSNAAFYKNIDRAWTFSDKNQYKFYHLNGVHTPYATDENLKSVGEGNSSAERQADGVLKMVNAYIDKMKENGIYDSSTIILTADHGNRGVGIRQKVFLMAKYPNQQFEKMQISNAPVSAADLHPTLSTMISGKHEYGKAYADYQEEEERERMFYYSFNGAVGATYYPPFQEYKIGKNLDNIQKTRRIFSPGKIEITEVKIAKWKTFYKFGSGNAAEDFFDKGIFSHRNRELKTSSFCQDNGLLVFKPDTHEDIKVNISYDRIVNAKQRFIVKSNDTVIHDQVYTAEKGNISFTVPKESIKNDVISLTFECPDADNKLLSETTPFNILYAFRLSGIEFSKADE